MAAYQPRMGPNVSKFIASLNTLPTAEENAEDDFGIDEDDLKLFMHTEFLVDDFEDTVDNGNSNHDNVSLGHPALDPSLDPIAPADFGRGRQPQQSESSDVVGGSNPANNGFDTVGLPALAAGGGHGDIKNLDFDVGTPAPILSPTFQYTRSVFAAAMGTEVVAARIMPHQNPNLTCNLLLFFLFLIMSSNRRCRLLLTRS